MGRPPASPLPVPEQSPEDRLKTSHPGKLLEFQLSGKSHGRRERRASWPSTLNSGLSTLSTQVPWHYGGVTVSPSPQPKARPPYLLPAHTLGLAKAANFYCPIPHCSFR